MRYEVVKESQSGHCCFEATVVDTTKPCGVSVRFVDGETVEMPKFTQVCETFCPHMAEKIAEAMNLHDEAPLEEVPREPAVVDKFGQQITTSTPVIYMLDDRAEVLIIDEIMVEMLSQTWLLKGRTRDMREYEVYGDVCERHERLIVIGVDVSQVLS